MKKSFEPHIIKYADFSKLKLMDSLGKFHQEVPIAKAKDMAREVNLDLVCFKEPNGDELAFCKIVNYGKWKFETEKNKKLKKKESIKTTKEIRVSPVISDHDLSYKLKQASVFLNNGSDVLFSMRLKGRQASHMGDAVEKMDRIVSSCENGKETSRKKTRNTIAIRLSKIDKGEIK